MGDNRELTSMPTAAYLDTARGWTKALEDREAARTGVRLEEARKIVARKTGNSPGTLFNLRHGRLKAIAVDAYDRLKAGVIRELEAELRHLSHELDILKQTGVDPRGRETAAVLADITKVREALGLDAASPDGRGE